MLKLLHLLPVSLLLFTLCLLILCPSGAAYTASFYPTRKPLMQQFQQSLEPGQSTGRSNIDDTILSIFKFGPENGLVLFNTTTKAPVSANSNTGGSSSWSTSPATHTAHTNSNDSNECQENAEGQPYCINVPNYEQVTQLNEINKQEFSRFEALFGEDVVELPNIAQRMNGEPEDLYHCNSKSKTIFPQKGETRDAGWMYIVNNDEYKQGVLVEICEDEGKTCNFSHTLPNQYTSSCKQHYIYRVLVAVAPNKKMSKQPFKIPSCCKCAIKQRVFI